MIIVITYNKNITNFPKAYYLVCFSWTICQWSSPRQSHRGIRSRLYFVNRSISYQSVRWTTFRIHSTQSIEEFF